MDDNACYLDERVALEFIAGKPAPTGTAAKHNLYNPNAVGASLLAMDDNENACCLDERVALASIAGKPRSHRFRV
jgi:hypothetical protein